MLTRGQEALSCRGWSLAEGQHSGLVFLSIHLDLLAWGGAGLVRRQELDKRGLGGVIGTSLWWGFRELGGKLAWVEAPKESPGRAE